jgi:hypothetical protein
LIHNRYRGKKQPKISATSAIFKTLPNLNNHPIQIGDILQGLKMLVYFMDIYNILQPFGTFYGHLVYFMGNWCILWAFGIFLAIWYTL